MEHKYVVIISEYQNSNKKSAVKIVHLNTNYMSTPSTKMDMMVNPDFRMYRTGDQLNF